MIIQVLYHINLRFCELDKFTIEALKNDSIEIIRNIKLEIPDMIVKDLLKYTKHKYIISEIIFRIKNIDMINHSNFLCTEAGIEEKSKN